MQRVKTMPSKTSLRIHKIILTFLILFAVIALAGCQDSEKPPASLCTFHYLAPIVNEDRTVQELSYWQCYYMNDKNREFKVGVKESDKFIGTDVSNYHIIEKWYADRCVNPKTEPLNK